MFNLWCAARWDTRCFVRRVFGRLWSMDSVAVEDCDALLTHAAWSTDAVAYCQWTEMSAIRTPQKTTSEPDDRRQGAWAVNRHWVDYLADQTAWSVCLTHVVKTRPAAFSAGSDRTHLNTDTGVWCWWHDLPSSRVTSCTHFVRRPTRLADPTGNGLLYINRRRAAVGEQKWPLVGAVRRCAHCRNVDPLPVRKSASCVAVTITVESKGSRSSGWAKKTNEI